MNKTVEVIKALTGLIKAFFEGFGVFEFLLGMIIILGMFAAFKPEALVALVDAIVSVLPHVPGG